MTALLLKLALGGLNILKLLGGLLKRFFGALNMQGWIGLALAVVLTWYALGQHGEARHWKKQSGQFETLYHNDQAAFAKTVANYRAAVEQARKADAANKARVEAEQAAINERTSHDYEARLAAARALAERLRASATHSGSGGSAPVPGISTPAGGPAQSADQDGFSLDDRLTATEQAIQLDEIIKWIRQQHAVDPNANR